MKINLAVLQVKRTLNVSPQRKDPPGFCLPLCAAAAQRYRGNISSSFHTEMERWHHRNPREPGRRPRTFTSNESKGTVAKITSFGVFTLLPLPFLLFSGTLDISLPQHSHLS